MSHSRWTPAGTIVVRTEWGQRIEIDVVDEFLGDWDHNRTFHERLVAKHMSIGREKWHVVKLPDERYKIFKLGGTVEIASEIEVCPPLVQLPLSGLFRDCPFQ